MSQQGSHAIVPIDERGRCLTPFRELLFGEGGDECEELLSMILNGEQGQCGADLAEVFLGKERTRNTGLDPGDAPPMRLRFAGLSLAGADDLPSWAAEKSA